ncbi:cupin domain-containing protein [Reichenbachiella sp. MALMAid0571]|uniref:cupin domain-containing protein n=1 Tax=Reichenbachiella sp. MALMAid0571 TaxID=3143939 RepID=UPI0032DE99DF
MKKYIKQTDPFIVPTGDDKLIEEHFGNASLKYEGCSICRCEAPPRWKEPYQNPEFDEIVIVSKGRLEIKIEKDREVIEKGQSILLKKGARIRFRNPFDQPCEYYSICMPPFSVKTANRE